MKAIAAFPETRRIELIDHPEPVIAAPTQVKLKMLHVGVCGTDREIWEFKYGTPPPSQRYLITGHESVGQVIAKGSGVSTLEVGDLVVPTVRRGCPEQCISCTHMQPDFCFTGHFTERGIKEAHGFMAEYVVDEERYMNRVPAELGLDAVLLEPLTIAEKAMMQVYTIQSRLHWECRLESGTKNQSCRNALVLGAGPVGLLGAMVFRLLGMNTTVVAREADPEAKMNIVRGIGAQYRSTQRYTPEAIGAEIGPIDVIFEATGAASVSFDFLPVLGVNGIFIFTGVPAPMKNLTIDAGSLMRNVVLKNQVILGTVNAPKSAFENGIRDLREIRRRWPEALDALITAKLPFAHFQETLTRTNPDEIKTVLQWA